MTTLIMHYQLSGGGEVDGTQRAGAFKRTFEYTEDKRCHVALVFASTRSVTPSPTTTLSHSPPRVATCLCQCSTLQVLGLGCRHVWVAVLHIFRSHVGLLHKHWLAEKAKGTPEKEWSSKAAPKWIVADRHARAAGTTEDYEEAAFETGRRGIEGFSGEQRDSPNGPVGVEGEGAHCTG